MSLPVFPAGSDAALNGSVSVTGTANCEPSGPKTYGVPTAVACAGMGDVALSVMVTVVLLLRAPEVKSMLAPLVVGMVPPVVPRVY